MSERKYQLRGNSKLSSEYTIYEGLFQDYVLSPLLFFIFIKDIFKFSESMSTFIFAYSTTLLFDTNLTKT